MNPRPRENIRRESGRESRRENRWKDLEKIVLSSKAVWFRLNIN